MFTALNTAVSGMRVAQAGLAITGHNMANAEIAGFSRQRTIQHSAPFRTLGHQLNGAANQVGLGTDRGNIHQIRVPFYDTVYRNQNTRLNFYMIKSAAGHQIETILGEMDGAYRFQTVMHDMWNALQELSVNLDGIETREFFLSTAVAFLNKAENVFRELREYQLILDGQVREMVADINQTVAGINVLNRAITTAELTGDMANDMRDERNRLIDHLSSMVPIDYRTCPTTSRVDIFVKGHSLLTQGSQNTLGLRQISPNYPFVEPVFTSSPRILPASTPTAHFTPLIDYRNERARHATGFNATNRNDGGALFALLSSRGAMTATYRGMGAIFQPVPAYARPPAPIPGSDFDTAPVNDAANDAWDLINNFAPPGFDAAFQNFLDELNDYRDAWDAWEAGLLGALPAPPNYEQTWTTGPTPPNPNDFVLPTPPGGIPRENELALMNAWREYSMERENDWRNFQRLYPESVQTPADFNAGQDAWVQWINDRLVTPGIPLPAAAQPLFDRHDAADFNWHHATWSKQNALVPRVMMQMDQLVNSIVTMLNDAVAPVGVNNHWDFENAPIDMERFPSQTPIFVRRDNTREEGFIPRFTEQGLHNPGLPGDMRSLYTTRNLMLNPALLEDGGWNLLALSLSGDNEDTNLLERILEMWQSGDPDVNPYALEFPAGSGHFFNVHEAYQRFVNDLAVRMAESDRFLNNQFLQTVQADNKRNSVKAVSLDEEMSNMMQYQFSYQAAARLFNVIDEMINTVVNRMGRVGL